MKTLCLGSVKAAFAMLALMTASAASAQGEEYEYNILDFTVPIILARGELAPTHDGAMYLSQEDSCHLVTTEWGWERSSCAAIDKIFLSLSERIDTVVVEKPNSDGYVSFEDWDKENREEEVQAIWESLNESIQQQGNKLGVDISLDSWLVHPTLDRENNYLYYATRMMWDGEPTVNIKASVFDRRGFVTFMLVPSGESFAAQDVKSTIQGVLNAYSPKPAERYADFAEGDKVATVGVLGVLAGIVGVKYGKVLAVGLGAILLAFAKKLWFLLFLPLILLKNKLFGKKD